LPALARCLQTLYEVVKRDAKRLGENQKSAKPGLGMTQLDSRDLGAMQSGAVG
jgi:hypothetical protein